MISKIEWLRDPVTGKPGYTINPVKGLCPVACEYCYARRMYKRFKWNPEIRWEPEQLLDLELIPVGGKVFIGSTMELFGSHIPYNWIEDILFWWITRHENKTFIFLTKRPENLSLFDFPGNCWVGVSVTNQEMHNEAIAWLAPLKAKVKFISYEPLLSEIKPDGLSEIQWVIIGQQTPVSKKTIPKIEWIREIVEAADKAQTPIFLKNNLLDLVNNQLPKTYSIPFFAYGDFAFNSEGYYRQEFPTGRKE